MTWDWAFVQEILPDLIEGAKLTLIITFFASIIALVLGLAWAILRRSRHVVVRAPVVAFIEFIRRTPLLVQLFFVYFVLPTMGFSLTPIVTGIVTIGLNYSTLAAEIYRAGIGAIPVGQWEAAAALDLRKGPLWRRVILPQAIPSVLPALGNIVISMFKETALLAAISVAELMQRANSIGNATYMFTEPLILAGAFYFVVSYTSSLGIRVLERRQAVLR